MMGIMTMMEMWFASIARAPARVDLLIWNGLAGPGLTSGKNHAIALLGSHWWFCSCFLDNEHFADM
jgi:hypothetical protein